MCDDRPSQITCHFLTCPCGLWASMRHPECSGQRRISNRRERVWGVRVLSKLCGMEIAPVHDRVFTVAVTRPAQFNLDELFLVVRESCARKNVQRSSRTLGTESDWKMLISCREEFELARENYREFLEIPFWRHWRWTVRDQQFSHFRSVADPWQQQRMDLDNKFRADFLFHCGCESYPSGLEISVVTLRFCWCSMSVALPEEFRRAEVLHQGLLQLCHKRWVLGCSADAHR